MSRVCSVCRHDRRGDIDAALARGETNRAVANRFDVSRQALQRHRANHLAIAIARGKRAAERRVAAVVQERAIAEVADDLDTMRELRRIFDKMHRLLDACDAWLADPDDATRYELGPRASELDVVYLQPAGEGRDGVARYIRRKDSLQRLLDQVNGLPSVSTLTATQSRIADPRRLILDATAQLRGCIELLAKIEGTISGETQMIQITNMIISRPA